jgi:hypothetical protein
MAVASSSVSPSLMQPGGRHSGQAAGGGAGSTWPQHSQTEQIAPSSAIAAILEIGMSRASAIPASLLQVGLLIPRSIVER